MTHVSVAKSHCEVDLATWMRFIHLPAVFILHGLPSLGISDMGHGSPQSAVRCLL